MSQTKCPFLRQLLQYLLVKLAPVILRVKPAGMLRLTNCRQLAGGSMTFSVSTSAKSWNR